MDQVTGSMEVLSAMQLTEDMDGLDAESKILLRNKEVLAVILGEVVAEYKGYSRREIMDFIEADSITDEKEVSPDRTNTTIKGDRTEYVQLNEKTSGFDLAFRAKNPTLSTKDVLVSLHMDVESQKSYQPGYPIEKRGMYYLARQLSSQLTLVTDTTDYNRLEKCYSIWICRDDIPKKFRYSVAVYEVSNTKDSSTYRIAKENYDLMTLVVIKLGSIVYNGDKEDAYYDLLRFLNLMMYPHKADFLEKAGEFIDFSNNEELWKEASNVKGLGQCVFEDGVKVGRKEGREEGREEGVQKGIQALILDNLEEKIPKARILVKLQKRFELDEEEAGEYYEKYAVEE